MSLPLAERVRPKTLSEYIGQKHLVGEGAILRQMIESGNLFRRDERSKGGTRCH